MSWPHRENHWDLLEPGKEITVVKRHIDGEERARYPGIVWPTVAAAPWVEIEAIWRLPKLERRLLTFEPGDILREFYSWRAPYNAFSVFTPEGTHKGWYANITYPAFIEMQDARPVLVWHDLLLDVIADARGEYEVLDEDELDESGLETSDPELYQRILEARDQILIQLHGRSGPFVKSLFAP